MGAPLTYAGNYFSDDGTEINVSVLQQAFHDATYANRLQGGFDTASATVGRFVGGVTLVGYDADGGVVNTDSSGSDGSIRVDLLIEGTDTQRIASTTLNYAPTNSTAQSFTTIFWKAPDAGDPDTGTGTGTSGVALLGSTDTHTGEGTGELRGFQSGARQLLVGNSGTQSPMAQWFVRDSGRSYALAGATTGSSDGGSDGGGDGGGGVITKPFPYPQNPTFPQQVTTFPYPYFYGYRALFPDQEQDEWVYVRLDILTGPTLGTVGTMRFQLTADVVTTADYQEITQEAVIDRLRRFRGRWTLKFENNLYFTTLTSDLGGQQGQGVDFVAQDSTVTLTVQAGWRYVALAQDNTGIGDFS